MFVGNTAGNAGGGIYTSPTLVDGPGISDTLFCQNAPDHIAGPWADLDGNEFHASCPECIGDLNDDSVVDMSDLLILLNNWGPCTTPTECPGDLNGDGVVDIEDLLILLANWGPCYVGAALPDDVQECYNLYGSDEARLKDCLENLE